MYTEPIYVNKLCIAFCAAAAAVVVTCLILLIELNSAQTNVSAEDGEFDIIPMIHDDKIKDATTT